MLPKLSWTHNYFLHGASFGTIISQNTFGKFCSMEYSKFWPVDHKKGNEYSKESSAPHTIYPEGPAAPDSWSTWEKAVPHSSSLPSGPEQKCLPIKTENDSLFLIEHLLQIRHYEKHVTYFKYLKVWTSVSFIDVWKITFGNRTFAGNQYSSKKTSLK